MATAAKINIKNIDYFKFKKIVIDGNRDDYTSCSKEVKSLCDSVQTLSFRDDEFDDVTDRARFDEIIISYRQILQSKRIDPTDMRIKNGWWVDANPGNVCSAGKFKPGALKETLVTKTKDWISRHGSASGLKPEVVADKLEGPGLYVFKHKEHACFQYVGKADKIFNRCAEKLKAAFDGTLHEPLAALLIISMASDWDFYFIPVQSTDGADILRILENDIILKHDCIWPHGLNFSLHIDSLLEVSEFRKSCLRHRWPPETDGVDESELSLTRLRNLEKTGEAAKRENGAETPSPSEPTPQVGLPSSKGDRPKTPAENGHPSESHPSQESTTEPSESVRKPVPVPSTGRPSTSSGVLPPRKTGLTRPSSAPKPPPQKQGGASMRPKSPALSQAPSAKRPDALRRSLDADDHRGLRAKSSGGKSRLERPRSSLDGRQVGQGVDSALPSEKASSPEGSGGMTRSKSTSSTTSIDSKKDKPIKETAVKETAVKETAIKETAKASGIKAPSVQLSAKRRPPTAKSKLPTQEVQQEVVAV